MRSTIPAAETAELMQLYRSLPPLIWEATNRIKMEPPQMALGGAQLDRYREANAKVVAVLMQIVAITAE